MQFSSFTAYNFPPRAQDGLFDAIGAAQHATECARIMVADVQTLLRMPFDLFWAHVLYDPSVKTVRILRAGILHDVSTLHWDPFFV